MDDGGNELKELAREQSRLIKRRESRLDLRAEANRKKASINDAGTLFKQAQRHLKVMGNEMRVCMWRKFCGC